MDPRLSIEEDNLLSEITEQSKIIKGKLLDFLTRNGVKIVHLRNITSLPLLHLPATKAVYDLITERQDIRFLLHHHDLPWEGPTAADFVTGYKEINELAERVMIPNFPNTSHIVINSPAAKRLWEERRIKAEVIHDGFNFEREAIHIDERAFLSDFGFREDDLLVGTMARVRPNKAIQMALQFTQALEMQRGELEASPNKVGLKKKDFGPESRIYLVLPQSKDLDEEYFREIKKLAKSMGVKLRFIGDRVIPDRKYAGQEGMYPFYSVYQPMDLIVHSSIHEGFGNQAIEAAWARRPLVMHEYPVAQADILPKVTSTISLGNKSDLRELTGTNMVVLKNEVVQVAAQQAIEVLLNHDLEEALTEKTYNGFEKLCDINRITDQYYRIYTKLASN